MRDAIKYYGSLIVAAHGASKRWLAVGATWTAYVVAAASALPAIEAAVPVLAEAWAGPVRLATLAGVFTLSLAGENWRRVRALAADRRLKLVLREVGWFRSGDHVEVKLDVVNLGVAPMGLRSEWTLSLYAAAGELLGVFDGTADRPLPLLQASEVFACRVTFPVGKGWWREQQPTQCFVIAFDAHNGQVMRGVPLRKYEGQGSVYP